LAAESEIALRVDAATAALEGVPSAVAAAADALTARLTAMERDLHRRGVSLADVRISARLHSGLRFVVREGPLALLALLVATLGRLAHWLPLRAARAVAMHSLGDDTSRDQPAMRTILFSLIFVVLWYAAIAAVLFYWQGALMASLGLALIFSAAHADRLLRGRMRRAVQRARTYLAFRRDPALQGRVLTEIDALLADALDLERSLASREPESAGRV
jgi:hypothetical protein